MGFDCDFILFGYFDICEVIFLWDGEGCKVELSMVYNVFLKFKCFVVYIILGLSNFVKLWNVKFNKEYIFKIFYSYIWDVLKDFEVFFI